MDVLNRRRTNGPRRAFTLVEVGVGVAIGTIICVGMMTLLRGGTRIFGGTQVHLEALQTAQMVAEIIREDLQFAVASGLTQDDGSGGTIHDFSPFAHDDGSNAGPNGGYDPDRPIGLPPPINLTEDPGPQGSTFTLYRTFGEHPNLTLGRVTYWLQERTWRDFTYYTFCREVVDGRGEAIGNQPKVREYRSLRVRHLYFLFHRRDVDNISGSATFTPDIPPWAGWLPQPAQQVVGTILGWFSGQTTSTQQDDPPRDYAYYVQFFVTGLSSTPQHNQFRDNPFDLQENLIVGIVSMDGITEKLRRGTGAHYWNTGAAGYDGVQRGDFNF